jgi:hypothetical protein
VDSKFTTFIKIAWQTAGKVKASHKSASSVLEVTIEADEARQEEDGEERLLFELAAPVPSACEPTVYT